MRPAQHTVSIICMLAAGEHGFGPSICAYAVTLIYRSSTWVLNSVAALTAVSVQQQFTLTILGHARLMHL